MFLSLATTADRADDLGYLLQKHPGRVFERELSVGTARVFYPEATADRCEVCLLLEADPVKLARESFGPGNSGGYAAAKPYLAGSLLAVALGRCFNTALAGRCREKVERLAERWPLTVTLPALPCRGGADAVRAAWEPLGYACEVRTPPLDPAQPAWGEAGVHHVTLTGEQTVLAVLNHLDAAVLCEVVEHVDPHRLDAVAASVFGCAKPRIVVLTTPNREYNAVWETLPAGQARHADHRFEWDRAEFAAWCDEVAARHGYGVERSGVGEDHPEFGPPSQMAVFTRI